MKSVLDEKQKVEQTEKSRLPVFSDEEKQIIKGKNTRNVESLCIIFLPGKFYLYKYKNSRINIYLI